MRSDQLIHPDRMRLSTRNDSLLKQMPVSGSIKANLFHGKYDKPIYSFNYTCVLLLSAWRKQFRQFCCGPNFDWPACALVQSKSRFHVLLRLIHLVLNERPHLSLMSPSYVLFVSAMFKIACIGFIIKGPDLSTASPEPTKSSCSAFSYFWMPLQWTHEASHRRKNSTSGGNHVAKWTRDVSCIGSCGNITLVMHKGNCPKPEPPARTECPANLTEPVQDNCKVLTRSYYYWNISEWLDCNATGTSVDALYTRRSVLCNRYIVNQDALIVGDDFCLQAYNRSKPAQSRKCKGRSIRWMKCEAVGSSEAQEDSPSYACIYRSTSNDSVDISFRLDEKECIGLPCPGLDHSCIPKTMANLLFFPPENPFYQSPAFITAMVVGSVVLVISVAIIVFLVLRCRRKEQEKRRNNASQKEGEPGKI